MGRVSKRDDKILIQLVKDCMMFGFNEYESLLYIEERIGGHKISRSNFYNIKKRISENEEEVVQERLTHHGRMGFALKAFEILDTIDHSQKILMRSLHEQSMRPGDKKNFFSISRIATNILENGKFIRRA